ncbi:Uncharacterised protein [uncultured archaeon]|nr:Uncharacterised protein [uncultured archaeon]
MMMPIGLMLQACGFALINRNDWISINVLVVLAGITIGALIFALANFLPAEKREKLRGTVRYELIEGVISLIIIIALIMIAAFACNAGGALFGYPGYTDIFNAADKYMGNLLFVNGISLVGNMYTVTLQYSVVAAVFSHQAQQLGATLSTPLFSDIVVIVFPADASAFFYKFASLFASFYGGMLNASFGGLFILFLALPIIEASALTVIAPTALIMRSLSFMGPQLRRTSNLFLAIAIGFYFVLPLMIALNSYIAGCLNISTGLTHPACNYPYFTQYFGGYSLPTMSSSLLTSAPSMPIDSGALPSFVTGSYSLPVSYYGSMFSSLGSTVQLLRLLPFGYQVAEEYGTQVAGYLFLGIVLVAIDLGVTAGFIMGIAKGLDSIANLFGTGPFFGG